MEYIRTQEVFPIVNRVYNLIAAGCAKSRVTSVFLYIFAYFLVIVLAKLYARKSIQFFFFPKFCYIPFYSFFFFEK